MKLTQWEITASPKAWKGYRVIVRGDGESVDQALKDASTNIGGSFRPKQDGRAGIQMTVTVERPDGTQFNIHPNKLRDCESPDDLEASKE